MGTEETAVHWKEGGDVTQRREEDADSGRGRWRSTPRRPQTLDLIPYIFIPTLVYAQP